jgi:hypothetical protein
MHGIEDRGGVVEEVDSAGMAIHQELPLPDLHVEPVHWNAQLDGQFGGGQHADGMGPPGALLGYRHAACVPDSPDGDRKDSVLAVE